MQKIFGGRKVWAAISRQPLAFFIYKNDTRLYENDLGLIQIESFEKIREDVIKAYLLD